ncbi:MAG TPA: GlsB/YeaQ/YmgE family stress response membrane protein, partial [Casimicrobiaceae bacterium]|nr:GlsB/YeaQ/YmgE family stress response membrane protein [Casimicrobiaceae bacterium]
MHWIWTIIIGFIAGVIAKFIAPGGGPSGFWLTAILGIAGAIVATFIGQMLGWYAEGQPAGFIASVVGAVVLLVIYHFARK